MAGTIDCDRASSAGTCVSMESGLDGRNNYRLADDGMLIQRVSMESGLDGRNNSDICGLAPAQYAVSMESGLDGRNNSLPVADDDE